MKKKIILTTFVLLWVSQMMAEDYTINVQSEGCNAVAYTLPSGAVGQIQATANTGYHFTQWSDGNTENPRTITVTGDKTYTASFVAVYTITAKSNNTSYGTVSGSGTYNVNTTVTLTATPKSGCKFVQWNDGSTQNPRTVTVTGDKTYTAQFAPEYTIGVKANGCDLYNHQIEGGKQLVIKAVADVGYKFVQWNDGSTQNPRTITVTGDKTYTATFAAITYTITAKSNNTSYGTVSGGGEYNVNATATLTATPKSGYKFVQWNDGSTQNPRTVTVTGDKTYTATFEGVPYTITAKSANNLMGTVSGSGTYVYNTNATLTATPNAGYEFVRWSDGNTQNPRTVIVTGDKTYTAVFGLRSYTITLKQNFTLMGDVEGGGTYEYNTMAGIFAAPKAGYHFVQWNDGNTDNPRYVKVTGDATYTAEFAVGASQEESHGATVNNDGVSVTPYETKADFVWPSITGVASYSLIIWADEAQGRKVCTLTFNANGQLTNIDFTQSVKPQGSASAGGLNFTVTGLKPSTTYAYTLDAKDAEDEVIETKHGTFTTMGADGIADITAAGVNIYTEGKNIIVENAAEAITVSDALGRVVGKDDAHIIPTETHKFPVPSSGVYVVKIGNRAASVLVR